MGFMDFLVGGTPQVTLPPAIQAAVEKLQYIPFGPERDALVSQISNTMGISTDQFNQSLQGLGGVLNQSEQTYGDAGNQMTGISNRMQGFAGSDPYMEYYGNPAAREQSYLAALQQANGAAFDPYGGQGSESQMRQGLMSANQARRGITNSGIARRQDEQEKMRMAVARQEADAKALQQVRQQGVQEAGAYQAAKGLASQNLQQAGALQNTRAQVASLAPQQRIQAANLYGNTQNNLGNKLFAAQTEDRTGQQSVASYNTEVQNKVNQDYASAQNQRNAQQASLDASRRKTGLLDVLGPIASLGMQAAGAFGGRGGSAMGNVAKAAGGAMQSMPSYVQSSWNPQLPSSNYTDYSKFGQSSANTWGGY
jgi:hypothetical protein